jgi:tripeptide aminopeptidase
MENSPVLNRFLRYVRFDTQSDEASTSFPSTAKQLELARHLKEELSSMGLADVTMTEWGYVMGTLPANTEGSPTMALIAHLDTSPDVSGADVKPRIHKNYQGQDIPLDDQGQWVLSAKDSPMLMDKIGKNLITASGDTLLGADNKAGIAEILTAVEVLLAHPEIPRPTIRVVITPDEEVGRGTEHITTSEIKADFGYTIDGEKLGEIEDETFSADTVEVEIIGVNVHPGYAKGKMINAVKLAAELIGFLPADTLSPETTEKREGYIHPYSLQGGNEKAVIRFLIRDFTRAGLKEKEDWIEKKTQVLQKKYPKAHFNFKVIESYRNMKEILENHPQVVEKAMEAVRMAGIEAIPNAIRGGTDGARLSFMGLPCPNIFTGGSNFHARTEWITYEDMEKAVEVIVNLARLWARP